MLLFVFLDYYFIATNYQKHNTYRRKMQKLSLFLHQNSTIKLVTSGTTR